LLFILFAVNVYRAATQSFTTDEAFTYNSFVDAPLADMFARYDANNHVLNTLLEKVSALCFGVSEFSLRLPSVLFGGGLYLFAVWALCRRVFGSGALFVTGVALLSLNPLVLDFLSAARGYGMALAFWMWALVFVLDCLEEPAGPQPVKLNLAAVALALSVCANLAFLLLAISTAVAFSTLWLFDRGGGRPNRLALLADRFILPGLAVAFVILLVPLNRAVPDNFYYGARDLQGALYSLIESSIFYDAARRPPFIRTIQADISIAVVVLLGATGVVCLWLLAHRGGKGRGATFFLLAGITAVLTLALTIAAHRWLGMPYPLVRTAIYWIPLLSAIALTLPALSGHRGVIAASLGVAGCVVAVYIWQFQTRVYAEWTEDATARTVARRLQRETGNWPIKISSSTTAQQTMEFYRRRLGMTRWQPIQPLRPDVRADYYVLLPPDAGLVRQRNLAVLLRSGSLLLAR
jgi:hypothetical protein